MSAFSPLLDGEIHSGRHIMSIRVYYEDTDFSGIVYHANYLRFMERGRTNHLRLLGAGHRSLFEEAQQEAPGFAFVVRSMQVEFLKPARMDDVLEVTTAPEEVKGASITLHQRIARGENLLVEAHVRVAFVCGGRARPIPKALRVAMQPAAVAGGLKNPLRASAWRAGAGIRRSRRGPWAFGRGRRPRDRSCR